MNILRQTPGPSKVLSPQWKEISLFIGGMVLAVSCAVRGCLEESPEPPYQDIPDSIRVEDPLPVNESLPAIVRDDGKAKCPEVSA